MRKDSIHGLIIKWILIGLMLILMIFLILFLRLVNLLIVNKSVNKVILFTFFLAFLILYVKIRVVRGDYMGKISYSTHGHFRAELIIIPLVLLLVCCIVFPNVKNAYSKVKMNSAIDVASSYKESVDNYFISKFLFDSGLKLDGTYFISSGNLISDDVIYSIPVGGNVPDSGYLDYSNNNLIRGCINIGGYSVVLENGSIKASKGGCDKSLDVVLDM